MTDLNEVISTLCLQIVNQFVPDGCPWANMIQNQRIIILILLIHRNENALESAADCHGRDK